MSRLRRSLPVLSLFAYGLLISLPLNAQDVPNPPGPQLCAPNSPVLTPASSLNFERVQGEEAVSVQTQFTNELGQAFTLTISSPDQDVLDQYLYGNEDGDAQFCFEAVSVDYVPSRGDGIFPDDAITGATALDILNSGELVSLPVTDYFDEALRQSLEEAGLTLDDVVGRLTALAQSEQETTLADLLNEFGVDTDRVFQQAVENANAEIDASVQANDLNARRADELRSEVEQTYSDLLNETGFPYLAEAGVDISTEPSVSVEITLDNPARVQSSDGYLIFFVIDPDINKDQLHWYSIPTAKWISAYVTVNSSAENGSIWGRLRNASTCFGAGTTVSSGTVTVGNTRTFSGTARRLCLTGRNAISNYTQSGVAWVNSNV